MSLDPRYACRCEFDINIDLLYEHCLGSTCGDDVVGGYGPEQTPTDYEAEFFTSDQLLFELSEIHIGGEIEIIDVLGYRSQVVAGTNYIVKYIAFVNRTEMFILAHIF